MDEAELGNIFNLSFKPGLKAQGDEIMMANKGRNVHVVIACDKFNML